MADIGWGYRSASPFNILKRKISLACGLGEPEGHSRFCNNLEIIIMVMSVLRLIQNKQSSPVMYYFDFMD